MVQLILNWGPLLKNQLFSARGKLKRPTASETFCIRRLDSALPHPLSFPGKWGTRRRTTRPPTATPPAATLLLPIPVSTLRARKSSPTTALASTKPRQTLHFSLYPSSILLSFFSLFFYYSLLSGIFSKVQENRVNCLLLKRFRRREA